MRQFCEEKSGIGRYLVQDNNDRCSHFFDCNEEIVSKRDPNLLIESFRIEIYFKYFILSIRSGNATPTTPSMRQRRNATTSTTITRVIESRARAICWSPSSTTLPTEGQAKFELRHTSTQHHFTPWNSTLIPLQVRTSLMAVLIRHRNSAGVSLYVINLSYCNRDISWLWLCSNKCLSLCLRKETIFLRCNVKSSHFPIWIKVCGEGYEADATTTPSCSLVWLGQRDVASPACLIKIPPSFAV